MGRIHLVGCGAFALVAAAALAQMPQDELVDRLAAAHGIDRWGEIEDLRFTFVVESSRGTTRRSWEWDPQENTVTMESGEEAVSYDRDEIKGASEDVVTADKRFINDTFWLIWPLHLEWADDVTVEDAGIAEDPLSGEPVRCIRVTYPPEGGGYTPGDRYDFFVNEQWLPTAWAFHRGSQEQASLVCSWEDYQQAGPLLLATDHYNKDRSFRLSIEDLAVRTEEGGPWLSTP